MKDSNKGFLRGFLACAILVFCWNIYNRVVGIEKFLNQAVQNGQQQTRPQQPAAPTNIVK